MEHLTKPGLSRLGRKAGIKSMSDDVYMNLYSVIEERLSDIVSSIVVVNSQHGTVTIMPDDVYGALTLNGKLVGKSTNLGTNTCAK